MMDEIFQLPFPTRTQKPTFDVLLPWVRCASLVILQNANISQLKKRQFVLHCHLTARPNSRSRTRDRLCGAITPSAAAYQISAQYGKFDAPLVGPLFVGPLFSRICWTCLNPPLVARLQHPSKLSKTRRPQYSHEYGQLHISGNTDVNGDVNKQCSEHMYVSK